MMVSGPSQAGKTEFALKLCKYANTLCTPPQPFTEILWHFPEYDSNLHQRIKQYNPKVKFLQGPPDITYLKNSTHIPKLLILDDLMHDLDEKILSLIFTRGIHHWGLSCVYIVQNLFYNARTPRINSKYLVLFKNPGDKLGVISLAKQIFPKNTRKLIESFEEATSHPYGYLLVDLSQQCHEDLRLRSQIFPNETAIVYTT